MEDKLFKVVTLVVIVVFLIGCVLFGVGGIYAIVWLTRLF